MDCWLRDMGRWGGLILILDRTNWDLEAMQEGQKSYIDRRSIIARQRQDVGRKIVASEKRYMCLDGQSVFCTMWLLLRV